MNKVTMLQEILAQNPMDSFARYGLAMEYSGTGQTVRHWLNSTSWRKTTRIMFPDISWRHKRSLAPVAPTTPKQRLQVGIAAAVRTGNTHAQREMQDLLDDLSS